MDSAGNIYVGGTTQERCSKGVCEPALSITKYNPAGDFVWETETGSSSFTVGQPDTAAMAIDPLQRVVVLYNDPVNTGFFVSQFAPDGAPTFYPRTSRGSGVGTFGAGRGVILGSDGTIFAAGSISNGQLLGNTKIALARFGSTGPMESRTTFPDNFSGRNEALALALDNTNFVYLAGYVTNANTGLDFAILKFSQKGELLWIDTFDGAAHKDDVATAVAVDKIGNVYVTGHSETLSGDTEIITIKYSPNPAIQVTETGATTLQFHTTPRSPYALEATTDFLNWQSLLTNTADANGLVQFTNTAPATLPFRFYRGSTRP